MRCSNLCLAATLLITIGCSRVEDVCSGLDEAACPADACVYEIGTGACLPRCDERGRCPEGLDCEEGSSIDQCRPGAGCLADALIADVCRAE